jgi:hypothetical protein
VYGVWRSHDVTGIILERSILVAQTYFTSLRKTYLRGLEGVITGDVGMNVFTGRGGKRRILGAGREEARTMKDRRDDYLLSYYY